MFGQGYSSVAEHFSSMHKALVSIPSTMSKEKLIFISWYIWFFTFMKAVNIDISGE
jgi:hypothetical protein